MSAVVLLVELKIAEGEWDAFTARVRRHRALVLENEPGCRCFDIVVPDGTENEVRLHEVYDDQAAVDLHMETDYMAAFREDTAPMVAHREIVTGVLANE